MSRKYKRKSAYNERDDYNDPAPELLSAETRRSIIIILVLLVAILSLLAEFDLAGAAGNYLKLGLAMAFGWAHYLFPLILLTLGYLMLRPEKYQIKPSNYLGFFFLFISLAGILQCFKDFEQPTVYLSGLGGGYLGFYIYSPLQKTLGPWAGLIVLLAIFLISLLVSFNTSIHSLTKKANVLGFIKSRVSKNNNAVDEEDEDGWEESNLTDWDDEADKKTAKKQATEEGVDETAEPIKEFSKKTLKPETEKKLSGTIPESINVTFSHNQKVKAEVPLNLLESRRGKPTSGDIKQNQEIIHKTLENFGINAEMGEVSVGPTITQFTLKPEEGVRLQKITALQDNLALALAAHPIRIEAPIPGKSLVGIEVPNQSITTVKLRDILQSQDFLNKKGRLKIALGEDVMGKAWVIDLADLPHLLIAGATGSGKSVCMNTILISMLFQYSPEYLRLIIVDPKKVEMTNFNGIPHLLTPVITEVDKTINALRWAVKEMDERYKLLNSVKKKNIEAYNGSVLVNRLPYIVIVIDELAELMQVAPRDVEAAIVRLAQLARAVGIHLIVATQRPSVNVITGLIKANITARIAFAVASQVDSRTILDFAGAEKLLGKGDMLLTTAEISKPRRLQGAYLNDAEIERVTGFWQQQLEPDYNESVIEGQAKYNVMGYSGQPDDSDALLEEAKNLIVKERQASATYLQRRLRVGYARAARILDLLEQQGVVGPANGAKPRDILIEEDDLYGSIPAETTEHYENDEKVEENNDDNSDDLENKEEELN